MMSGAKETAADGGEGASSDQELICFAMVGAAAVAWSGLERLIDNALCRLAGVEPSVGLCLVSQIQSVRNKLLAMEALLHCREASPATCKEIRAFMNSLEATSRRRNRAVHDVLFLGEEGALSIGRRYIERRLVDEEIPANARDLSEIHLEIRAKIKEFRAFSAKIASLYRS